VPSRRGAVALLVLLVAGALLAGCGGPSSSATVELQDNDGFHGTRLDQPYRALSVPLKATDGSYDLTRSDAGLDVVFFGYTHCPDICQVVMGTIASAYTRLSAADRHRVRVAFVTTDPARDDVATLKSYLSRFDPAFVGVTGPLPAIERMAKPLHTYVKQGQRLPSGGYEVTHGTSVFAVQHGRASVIWDSGTSPTGMAADMKKLLKESGS